ncbi:uncharacterized protein LOC131060755 isoform X2 [Cryptomeria japonica]|uniref:uncharacterized protein LOC131060755 isoform X2 n=1 Tax=Cryptomeria japonica TaxID=3369 RepID=UPI0025ABFFB3|nr:uncharacterized protein LOC131060755 isoform X2 [Cryptomeria japonica]
MGSQLPSYTVQAMDSIAVENLCISIYIIIAVQMKAYHNKARLAAVFWLAILLQFMYSYGKGACNLQSIEIKQFMLEDKWKQGDMMRATYYVSITNSGCLDTACLPHNVVMWCPGMPSTDNLAFLPNTILSAYFIAGRDLYILNEGEELAPDVSMGFNYTVALRGIGILPPIPLPIPIVVYSADFCS